MFPLSFYPIAILAVLLIGISKSGFGGGLGVLGVPLMSLIIAPPKAAAILLPLLITIDFLTVYHYRRQYHKRNLRILFPGALLGIILGSLFFRYLSDAHIRLLIGGLALIFVGNHLLQNQTGTIRNTSVPMGFFWGAVAGFTSFGVHAGGPPVNIYLLPQQLDKTLFVGTTVVFFTLINLVKVVPYAILGQFSSENLVTSLLLGPVAVVGVWLGMKLHRIIDAKTFYNLCYLFLFITGCKLLYDGIMALLK